MPNTAEQITLRRPVAESIAELASDLRAGRFRSPLTGPGATELTRVAAERATAPQPVVEAQRIFTDVLDRFGRGGCDPYGAYPSVTPPWENALIGYVNRHGNTFGLQVHREPWAGRKPWPVTGGDVNWAAVRWLAEAFIWLGGWSQGQPMQTTGPCRLFQTAIYADGTPADLHWVQLVGTEPDNDAWELHHLVFSAAMNFLNCRNVDIAEPGRPRPERRRIERTGTVVQTIVVRPPSRLRRSAGTAPRRMDADDQPLSPVRGHFAHYGPLYDRALLFGKYEGKFWIPGHVRGGGGQAEPRTYLLRP